MKYIDWNRLTPVCYAVGEQEGMDLGVAADMLFHSIRAGEGLYAGSYMLGAAFTPDYQALRTLWESCAAEEREEINVQFNRWLNRMRSSYSTLCALWTDRRKSFRLRCNQMIALMEQTEAAEGEHSGTP